jgi:hypothetical protein
MGKESGDVSPAWFGRRRNGWNFRPASWQGWAATALYGLLLYAATRAFRGHHVVLFIIALLALTAAFGVIAVATSRRR